VNKPLQDQLARRLFEHIDARSTDRTAEEMAVFEREYAHPDRVRAEREQVIAARPALVCASGQVREPGAFLTRSVLGTPVLIARQADGSVRAFRNVCRHRCARVVNDEVGVSRSFSCSYHGWTYSLDGSLLRIPDGEDSFPNTDLSTHGLVELPAQERHGHVWILTTPGTALDVERYLGPQIDAELGELHLDAYEVYREQTFDQPANWKLIMDGFLEVYHVRYLHPATVGKITISNVFVVDALGDHLRMASARRDIEKLRPVDGVQPPILPGIILTYALMPNTVIVYVRDHIETWTIVPHETDPARSRITLRLLVPELPSTDKARRYWQRNWDTVVGAVENEDWAAARSIQTGLDAESKASMVLGRNELALHHFHSYLRAAMGE
jgi:nitrite reductase/ring-hydroxylating ferredoxin subunit